MNEDKTTPDIKSELAAWEETTVAKRLASTPERLKDFTTLSGDIKVQRLYTPLDVLSLDYVRDLGFPGAYPFTRGREPLMYRGRLWGSAHYAGFGSAEDTNKRYKYLLSQGQRRLVVAMDLPTQMGYDSDHKAARGEVGKMGVSVNSLKDIEEIFDGIPLTSAPEIGAVANCIGPIALAWFIALGEKQGLRPDQYGIVLQNDPFKEYLGRGTYIFPVKYALRLCVDVIEYVARNAPHWNPLTVAGTGFRWSGSTATQEIAFAIALAVGYIEEALARGLHVDQIAPSIRLHLTADNDFFEEAAKLRAVRRLWARTMAERFGAKKPESMMLRMSLHGAGYAMTAQQPLNNIVRGTLQALGGILGGADSVEIPSYDEALGLPTQEAVTMTDRIQQILAYEGNVANTVDPLAGSYYVEALTDAIDAKCNDFIRRVDQLGGAVAAVEKGFLQREIEEAAYRYQREVESGERVIVGVNKFESESQTPMVTFKVDPGVEERTKAKLFALRQSRDNQAVAESLRKLKVAAEGEGNLVPPILEAVKAYATTAEICDALREVFGEYREHPTYI